MRICQMKAGETDTMKTLIKHRKVTTIQQIVPKANNDVCIQLNNVYNSITNISVKNVEFQKLITNDL